MTPDTRNKRVEPPQPKVEMVRLLPDESFRFLRWHDRDVTHVEAIGTDGKAHPFKGAGDVWHFHPGMELVLVTQGMGTRFVGDSIAGFNGMDLVLLGPNLPHYWHGTQPLSGYALQFAYDLGHTLWNLPETRELSLLWKNAQRGIQFTGCLPAEVLERIGCMLERGGVGRLALFLEILEKLARAPAESWTLLSQKSAPGARTQYSCMGIQKAVHLVLNSYHQELTFADVLELSGMSRATFERQFKRHTGKTFTRFLTEVRIDSARRQLIETAHSIAEIAFASGFNNLSHFNHQFALIHNEPPGAFRARMKKQGP